MNPSHRFATFRAVPLLLGLLVVALGSSGLLGWALDIPALKSVFQGLATMKPNTATGLVLGGAALALLSRIKTGTPHRFCAAVLAIAIAAVGALTLGEYFFGWNVGIDELLFRDATQSSVTSRAGRMSPATAFCFVLAGSALWAGSQQMFRRFRFSGVSGLGATLAVIGGVACLGQISDALLHFRLWNYFGMAVHTAAGFFLLGSGLLALAGSEGGMEWVLGKSVTGGFIAAIAIMVTAAGVSWNHTYQLKDASVWVSHTHEVLKEIEDVRADMMELESSQRGYLILGDEQLLTPREQIKTDIRQSIDNLRSLTADNPHQKPRLDQLEPLIDKRTVFGEQTIVTRRKEGFPAAEQMLATRIGINLSAEIERVLGAMRDEEDSLLVTREKQAEAVSTATFLLLPVAVFLSLTILSLALFFLNAGVTEREQAEAASARLAAIVNSSNDAIIGKDLNSIVTSWNPGAVKMFGYSAKEMIGQSVTRLIPPDRQQEEMKIIAQVRHGETVDHFDTVRVAKDGHPIDIAATVSPIKDKTGKIVGASKVARDIGERKQAEKALRRERDFISAVVDTVGSLVVVIDRQARIIRFNRYCEQLTGYSFAEAQGRNLIDLLILPEERKTTTAEFLNLCAGQFPNTFENHWVTKEGKPRVIAWSNTALLDAEGKVEYVIGTGTDITEIKRAEEAQRATEARYRTLFDYAPNGIVIADTKGYWLDANASMCRMLGYAYDEVIGLHASKIVAPEDTPNIEPALSRVKAKLDHHREGQFRRKDGSIFPTEIHATLMPDGNMVGMISDISERKRAEATLRRQAAIIDLSPDAIIVRDLDGKIVSWSRGAETLYGWTKEEVLGRVTHSLFETRFSEPLEKIMEQFEKTGRWSGELAHRTKDGRRVDVQSWWLAEFNALGKRTGMLESNIDITERKRAEQEIHELNTRLEQRVAERTVELEAANKELEAFSYSVSHDLRAPLRAVDGFAQAVVEDYGPQLPEEGQRYLQTIREGAQRMGILIDDLLTFSRLSRSPLNKQEVNTRQLVDNVLEDLKSQREGRQVEIRIGDLPECLGDPALLKQVWVNLLSNALKYTRQRETAVIEIGCKREQEGNVYFVRDNGAGFDMRYVNKLFGVFQRLHRADQFEGTGVGLAIVQRIVHRHGGRIWAEAALNRGATFYFTLKESISS